MSPHSSGLLAVLTPTGNTGRHVVETALARGETVRVLVRDATRLEASVRERCQVVQGDMLNPADLAQVLSGADGAFFCVPQSPDPADIPAYYRAFTEPFAQAAKKAGVQRIVSISGGDDSGEGFEGIGQALLDLRQTLNATGLATRHLLCGYFMEGFFYQLYPIAQAGFFSLPVAGNIPIPFVAAQDIGAAAARLLSDRTWTDQRDLAAHGPMKLTCDEAAVTAGEVVAFPVRFQPASGNEYRANTARFGVSDAMGRSLVAMFEAITAGKDMGAPAAHSVDCPTILKEWMESNFKLAVERLKNAPDVSAQPSH